MDLHEAFERQIQKEKDEAEQPRSINGCREIQIANNKTALVDEDEFEYLSQWRWNHSKRPKPNLGYAVRMIQKNGVYLGSVYMHRAVLRVEEDGVVVDHINGNTLDNRKSNLRTCSQLENRLNSKMRGDNKSGFKGVHYSKINRNWVSQLRLSLGSFKTPEEAHAAYVSASEKLLGAFARPNSKLCRGCRNETETCTCVPAAAMDAPYDCGTGV